MQKFILFYKGPATPPDASHEGWPEWFGKMGDKLMERGFPLLERFTVHADHTASEGATNFNGYSIIQAENRQAVEDLLSTHPYLALGEGYSIEVFALPS